jgi:hypothetical protein
MILLTYEEVTGLFLKAAANNALMTHPEYWQNARSLEREFACTCHIGTCEEAEQHSTCTVSFSWTTLDTALSIEEAEGICDFFHEPDAQCPHLHTHAVPPLVIELSYTLPLNGITLSEELLLMLTQALRLHASEYSRRTTETRPGVSMVLNEGKLQPEALTLQQRVEVPIWHPAGMRGLHEDPEENGRRQQEQLRKVEALGDEDEVTIIADHPKPEEWLPQLMEEVCQDVLHVIEALDASLSYNMPGNV